MSQEQQQHATQNLVPVRTFRLDSSNSGDTNEHFESLLQIVSGPPAEQLPLDEVIIMKGFFLGRSNERRRGLQLVRGRAILRKAILLPTRSLRIYGLSELRTAGLDPMSVFRQEGAQMDLQSITLHSVTAQEVYQIIRVCSSMLRSVRLEDIQYDEALEPDDESVCFINQLSRALKERSIHLEQLEICSSDCPPVSSTILWDRFLFESCLALKTLKLERLARLKDQDVQEIATCLNSQLPNLKSLRLRHNPALTKRAGKSLVEVLASAESFSIHCTLRSLDLSGSGYSNNNTADEDLLSYFNNEQCCQLTEFKGIELVHPDVQRARLRRLEFNRLRRLMQHYRTSTIDDNDVAPADATRSIEPTLQQISLILQSSLLPRLPPEVRGTILFFLLRQCPQVMENYFQRSTTSDEQGRGVLQDVSVVQASNIPNSPATSSSATFARRQTKRIRRKSR